VAEVLEPLQRPPEEGGQILSCSVGLRHTEGVGEIPEVRVGGSSVLPPTGPQLAGPHSFVPEPPDAEANHEARTPVSPTPSVAMRDRRKR
jgi:hypothetical protein